MKAITILQPWAGLIPAGAKTIETRSWSTKYRGPIAIHAAKDQDKKNERIRHIVFRAERLGVIVPELHFGAVIAIADLTNCLKVIGKISLKIGDEKRVAVVLENDIKIMGNELEFGDYTIGRYAWLLKNIKAIDPIPARGQQRIWNWGGDGMRARLKEIRARV
ncbi:ASCH domain-containing protein [Pelosinus sp. UFO1]|uniref:ASCH domain-containing protein n=1 Tax=Pelosinus sp. UFO1 TaxID=484770 RepID=UPI0004D0E7EA|nr:ASCH domain-containing protein [Pelosinus sp. UFO1]AIF51825.1 ASCH domain protein [Pelosinus sp. UFO1]